MEVKKRGKWQKSYNADDKKLRTKSGSVHANMETRCRIGGAYQVKFPSYAGCTMSDEFKDFQRFTDWHVHQPGYGVDGYQLDKDLLGNGSKVYSRETCVLLPYDLNSFFTDAASKRSMHGIGTCYLPRERKYKVKLGNRTLGKFNTRAEAFAAYKTEKEALAKAWALRLETGEFPIDPRVISALRTWEVK